jgi:hypothetical protein
MRRAVIGAALSVGVIAVGAAPANGAATRAEYIAQVDPTCQVTIDAEGQAAGPKGFVGPLNHGHYKAAGRSMRRVFAAFGPGVEQVAALEPPAADAQLIATWVQDLRAQVPLGNRVAGSLIKNRLPRKLLGRLGKLNRRTQALVASYGFTSCNRM